MVSPVQMRLWTSMKTNACKRFNLEPCCVRTYVYYVFVCLVVNHLPAFAIFLLMYGLIRILVCTQILFICKHTFMFV